MILIIGIFPPSRPEKLKIFPPSRPDFAAAAGGGGEGGGGGGDETKNFNFSGREGGKITIINIINQAGRPGGRV